MEVPSEVLPKLVCENCDGYLSRGPVHLMNSVGYRCGRCLPSEEEQSTRIEAYEELAKLMTFPCRYQHNGCTSKVPFVENEAHEEACPYRKYICPIADSGQCEWTGIQTELLEHCQQQHPDNVVENPCTFTHNITRSSLHNYLLWTLGVLFLIQTKVCTATRKIYHSVRLISDPARATDYKYKLYIQNKDSGFYKHREVAPRGCLALQNDSAIQTDINGLLAMLEDFTGTTFTVTVESAGNRTTEVLIAAESSSANTPNTTTVAATDVSVECNNKYQKHKSRFCKQRMQYECTMISHADIIHRVGTVCTVRPINIGLEFWIVGYSFGRVVCTYKLLKSEFALYVYTPVPSEQLCKYKCAVHISHPDPIMRHRPIPLYYLLTVGHDTDYDWSVQIPRDKFDRYMQCNAVNIQIDITAIADSTEFNL